LSGLYQQEASEIQIRRDRDVDFPQFHMGNKRLLIPLPDQVKNKFQFNYK
jgi:hypothetical protein